MTSFKLIVLKTNKLEKCRSFYETLGMSFVEESHGLPTHYSAQVDGVTFELFPGEPNLVRLGFTVSDLGDLAKKAKDTPWGRRAVTKDPDGRPVEVYLAAEE